MSSSPHAIRVLAQSSFLAEQSEPGRNRYVFSYTVSIQNIGSRTAQLLARHWVITDALGKVQEVRGQGVVGEQPVLEPGQSFEYTSGAVIETPLGTMTGSYQMVGIDGQAFDAEIPPFRLAVPNALH